MKNMKRWSIVAVFLLFCSSVTNAQVTNENPPAAESYTGDACAVLLDDIAASGGFIRACSGDNGSLGHLPNCPIVGFGRVGLRIDPDSGGPLVESEDANEGTFEERWCLEYDTAAGANINRCNTSSSGTGMGGFTQVNTSTPGQLQATGNLTTAEGVRVDQVVTLASLSSCVQFEVTLTNNGAAPLNDVEYLRSHDPDLGIQLGLGFSTRNQTLNRPLPPGPLPTLVAATVFDGAPVETRTVGLGTNSVPRVAADVSINNSGLIQSDPDAVFSGAGVNRGITTADVANTLAFQTPSLEVAESVTHDFCYCFASALATQDNPTALAEIAAVFAEQCPRRALDHFKCYEAEGDGFQLGATVDLVDQFETQSAVLVGETELFCNPVAKTVGQEVTEIGDRTAHLTGYEIEGDDDAERIVTISNQFGEQTLEVEEAELLFVPSEKDGQASALNIDHFKCYEAEGAAVNVIADLDDQFGLEPGVLAHGQRS